MTNFMGPLAFAIYKGFSRTTQLENQPQPHVLQIGGKKYGVNNCWFGPDNEGLMIQELDATGTPLTTQCVERCNWSEGLVQVFGDVEITGVWESWISRDDDKWDMPR